MAANINNVTLEGHLVDAPRMFADGKVARFRMANNVRVKRDGEWGEHASFYEVVVFGSQAGPCERFLTKGSRVTVTGVILITEREHEGTTYRDTEIHAERVYVAPASSGNGAGPAPAVAAASTAATGATWDEGDDIPF